MPIAKMEIVEKVYKCSLLPNPQKTLPEELQLLFLNSSEELEEVQKQKLFTLLSDFQEVFSLSKKDLGRTSILQHKINTGDAIPIKQPPRRLSYSRRAEAESLVTEMHQQGIIRPSQSPWSSPVVLVKKKDGSLRFCVDYRKLNEVTKKDSYPLPRIDLTLDALGESCWFATLDLLSGYFQVEMDPADREKTAFSTGSGLYEFNVMPFGLTNAPATFQRLMEIVLRGIPHTVSLRYLDDLCVHAKTFDGLVENLKLVFDRLRKAGLKLSPKKCHLCRREVKFLGHVISGQGISTDPDKIETVKSWPRPQSKTDIQSFLGLCAYYRRFVKDFSLISKPLTALTEKRALFLWTEDCEIAFEALKNKLTTAPILSQPNDEDTFVLDTDASYHAWGAVLSQLQEGEEKVIEYYSKTLSKVERNYCVTRKELLAVVKAVTHFQPYLLGRNFIIRTDHASLRWLMNFKEPEGQIARWLERLQEFNFDIKHRSGTKHVNADAMSRRPCLALNCLYCPKLEERSVVSVRIAVRVEDIEGLQEQDDQLKTVRSWLQNGMRPSSEDVKPLSPKMKQYWSMFSTLSLKNGIAYRTFERLGQTFFQILIPDVLKNEIVQQAHDSPVGGHLGVDKTLARVKERYYWAGCSTDVRNHCLKCTTCQQRKGPIPKRRAPLQIVNCGAPFERLAVDILGPLPLTQDGFRYILVVLDYFTRWPEAIPMRDQTAETVSDALIIHVFSRFGLCRELHSDQGRNFEAEVFQKVLFKFRIHKTRTTPLHPQSDGLVERFNRTILDYLAKFVSEHQRDWDTYLPFLLLSLRSAVQKNYPADSSNAHFGS